MSGEIESQHTPTDDVAADENLKRRRSLVELTHIEVLDHDRLRSKAEYEIDMVGVDQSRTGRTLKRDFSVRFQIELCRKLRGDAGL